MKLGETPKAQGYLKLGDADRALRACKAASFGGSAKFESLT